MEEIDQKLKLSIITVNLNNKEGLAKTISSVITQTYRRFEFIIIDGASLDGSIELVMQNQDDLAYWISEKDTGIYQAMNKGIRAAKGDYLLFLNSGDFLVNNYVLDKVFQTEFSEDILYGASYISKNDKIIYTTPHPDKLTLDFFFTRTVSHQAAFIKRKLFDKYGLYREDLRILSDLDFWIRTIIINNCSTRKIDVMIAEYNLEGLSSKSENEYLYKKEAKEVLSKNIPENILTDYEFWNSERKKLQLFYWGNNIALIRITLSCLYQLAKLLNKVKTAVNKRRKPISDILVELYE